MDKELFQFDYEVYDSPAELSEKDISLLKIAQQAASNAYAPYSRFCVGAAAELKNGEIVTGGNQENISFPAGLCAEGVVMAVASSQFPGVPINTLALSYHSSTVRSDHPVAPCGICRQALREFMDKTGASIRLILAGMEGKVIIVPDASSLLPLAFRF